MSDTKATLTGLLEVRNMLTAGMYQSSYEGQIVDKLDAVMRQLTGPEIVGIEFFTPRADLLELFESPTYAALIGEPAALIDTPVLLSLVLQYALYDSPDGPQMEGEYKLIQKDAADGLTQG